MSWRDLVEDKPTELVLPWFERDRVHTTNRTFELVGDRPPFFGWWLFATRFREATFRPRPHGPCQPEEDLIEMARGGLITVGNGYLVGDQFISGTGKLDLRNVRHRVRFIPEGLERFQPVECGVISSSVGPMFFKATCGSLDPVVEIAVREAYEDRAATIEGIKGVHPALDLAFRMETWRRNERERLETIAEERRRQEDALRALQEKRAELERKLGSGASRREVAKIDINTAAKAALRVGNADLLDLRAEHGTGNHVVRFRVDGERFECVIDQKLQVLDAGICLVDHRTGIKGDTWFTLESLPSVIREAIEEDKLVRFRHA